MRDSTAFVLIISLALLADGLMESLGPLGFCLVSALTLAVAWVLIEWPNCGRRSRSNKPKSRKNATPDGANIEGGKS